MYHRGLNCGLGNTLSTNEPPGYGTITTNDPAIYGNTGIYATISNLAGSGSSSLGDISTFLLNLGLGVEAARSALITVQNNVGGNPQQLAAINAELNYINSGAYAQAQNKNAWLLPVLLIGGLILLTRER